MEEIFLILVGIAWALGTPLIAIMALVRTSGLRAQNERLAADLAALRREIATAGAQPVLPPLAAPPFVPELEPEPKLVPETPPQAEPEAIVIGTDLPVAAATSMPPPATPAVEPVKAGWEQRLGARAFLWVGAITLALAAIFLVRYSIEEGYLSPEVRVILAALFGFALIAGAERLRPRDDRVSQALAAAGVAALYGSLLSAVALYGMISKVAAGGGAAALTAFAITLSLRYGIFVAALAFVGGFLSPAIIGSEQPNTPVLFGYLLAIAAGTLTVIRMRGWWVLGWGVLAGSALWTARVEATQPGRADDGVRARAAAATERIVAPPAHRLAAMRTGVRRAARGRCGEEGGVGHLRNIRCVWAKRSPSRSTTMSASQLPRAGRSTWPSCRPPSIAARAMPSGGRFSAGRTSSTVTRAPTSGAPARSVSRSSSRSFSGCQRVAIRQPSVSRACWAATTSL